ncbi:glycosyltransferase [Ferrovibrio sp.]|uniref:glycosyltransferase n=1 Tax=Ferrovibrio sp. TaxID=1917215 RepID=UPI000CB3CFE8|nr:glycosyltransferase [Ferrovibrio sp.]PJI41927.1 MAG: glycosyl transferase group 1 family protein [Ferrovibrio sp.]
MKSPIELPNRRLTVVIGSLDRGGAEWHLLQVLPRLLAHNFTVEVFCLHHRGELASEMERRGVSVFGPERVSTLLPKRILYVLFCSFILFFHLLKRRPDIVHFFLPAAYILGAPAAVLARCRIRIMSRRSQNNYQRDLFGSGFIERQWHRRMSAVLGNSQSVVDQLRDEGVPESKLYLLYNGVDLSSYGSNIPRDAARSRLGLSNDALVFLIVANLIPYKGHADLLRALAMVNDRLPENWVLLCAGRDDGIGSNLQDLVEELGLTQRVHWLGSVKDIPSLLTAGNVALLASHEEGFSNAIIEYMASGLPAIVTDVGGNAEAIEHGKTGFVVPAKDSAGMADAILELALNAARRREMGALARTIAIQRYSLEACVDRYAGLYRKILRAHGMD